MVMAVVYTNAGRFEEAMDELEIVLSIPGGATVHSLRVDPLFAPLRDLPRFQTMLEQEYGLDL